MNRGIDLKRDDFTGPFRALVLIHLATQAGIDPRSQLQAAAADLALIMPLTLDATVRAPVDPPPVE